MSKINLYTEEQVLNMLNMTDEVINGDLYTYDEIIKSQTPIELPSDEEISIQASNRHYGTNFKHVYASGVLWLKEQILNQHIK